MPPRPKKTGKITPAMLDGIDVPILILDPVWLDFFRHSRDGRIAELQDTVKERLKEIARVNETREALIKRKRTGGLFF